MSELTYLPVSELYPHPDNPRKNVDDLEELAASIKANGVLQNLTVIKGHYMSLDEWIEISKQDGVSKDMAKATFPEDENFVPGGYTVIIGHRRLAASKLAGLTEVPCTIANMSEKEQIQTMLLENMQRKDLKVYEEAQGFQMLLDFGDTVDEVSEKSGFSSTTIRRRVKLNELDQKKLKEVVDSRQISLSAFDELAKIEDVEARNEVLAYVGTDEFRYQFTRAYSTQEMEKKLPAVYKWLEDNKVKELSSSARYGASDYDRIGSWNDFSIDDWEITKKNLPKPGKERLYYYLDRTCRKLELYRKEKREKAPKPTQEEIEKTKRMEKAWEYIEAQSRIFCNMRKAFIDQLTVTKANEIAVLKGAILSGMLKTYSYCYCGQKDLSTILGMQAEQFTGNEYTAKALKTYHDNQDKINLAQMVYALFGDREKELTTYRSWRREWPEYEANPRLTFLYEWLTSVGYKMSEAEKGLVYGKAKIYEKDSDVPDSEPIPSGEAAGDTDN